MKHSIFDYLIHLTQVLMLSDNADVKNIIVGVRYNISDVLK